MWRQQCEVPETLAELVRLNRQWRPERIAIESAHVGIAVYQQARRLGLPVCDVKPRGKDKVVRTHRPLPLDFEVPTRR